jgi:hypothetical protein
VVNKGFKPLSPAKDNIKLKGKKKTLRTPPSTGKDKKFIISQPEFLDLSAIDKYFSSGLTYPHIHVH